MSKERLEEFKKQIDFLDDSADMDDFGRFVDTLQNMYEDGEFHWIVRYIKEQAERVQELEGTNKKNYWIAADFKFENLKLEQQNKRCREALEFYADASIYNFETETDFDVGETRIISEGHIFRDFGRKAREALEGEE